MPCLRRRGGMLQSAGSGRMPVCIRETLRTLTLAAAMGLLPAACDRSSGTTRIGEVVAAQAQYAGREVSVRGVVKDATRVPAADLKLYSLAQDGARMVVVTRGELPPLQQSLRVRGRVLAPAVVDGIPVRPRMTETDRRIVE